MSASKVSGREISRSSSSRASAPGWRGAGGGQRHLDQRSQPARRWRRRRRGRPARPAGRAPAGSTTRWQARRCPRGPRTQQRDDPAATVAVVGGLGGAAEPVEFALPGIGRQAPGAGAARRTARQPRMSQPATWQRAAATAITSRPLGARRVRVGRTRPVASTWRRGIVDIGLQAPAAGRSRRRCGPPALTRSAAAWAKLHRVAHVAPPISGIQPGAAGKVATGHGGDELGEQTGGFKSDSSASNGRSIGSMAALWNA